MARNPRKTPARASAASHRGPALPVASAIFAHGVSLPWFPLADGVHIKLYRANLATGQCVLRVRAAPGADLGTYCLHGVAIIHTLSGHWRYRESGWVAAAGDVVIDPAGITHAFEVVGNVAAETFVHLTGALEFLDPAGATLRVENAETLHARYLAHCALHGLEPLDVASR